MEPEEDDGEPFPEKMARLVADLRKHRAESRCLDKEIAVNLR